MFVVLSVTNHTEKRTAMKQQVFFNSVLLRPSVHPQKIAFSVLVGEPLILNRVLAAGFAVCIYLN
ncbi:hypothetical protein BUE76_10210 [Cnuella takakiae]|nr:hypothetical protein BUE76_10210 [Cnuella takakiae]